MSDLAFPIDADKKRWAKHATEIDAWRGEMINLFAQAEAAVGETLLAAGCGGQAIHLVGAKHEKLAELFAEGGKLAAVGGQARHELAKFREYDRLRSVLCHGAVMVAIDASGHWIAIFRMTVFRSGGTEQETAVFSKAEAREKRDALRSRQASLLGQLRRLRNWLAMSK